MNSITFRITKNGKIFAGYTILVVVSIPIIIKGCKVIINFFKQEFFLNKTKKTSLFIKILQNTFAFTFLAYNTWCLIKVLDQIFALNIVSTLKVNKKFSFLGQWFATIILDPLKSVITIFLSTPLGFFAKNTILHVYTTIKESKWIKKIKSFDLSLLFLQMSLLFFCLIEIICNFIMCYPILYILFCASSPNKIEIKKFFTKILNIKELPNTVIFTFLSVIKHEVADFSHCTTLFDKSNFLIIKLFKYIIIFYQIRLWLSFGGGPVKKVLIV